MKNKIISNSKATKVKPEKKNITFYVLSCGYPTAMVMHTHNIDQSRQKGDVTGRMEGWEPGTKGVDLQQKGFEGGRS